MKLILLALALFAAPARGDDLSNLLADDIVEWADYIDITKYGDATRDFSYSISINDNRRDGSPSLILPMVPYSWDIPVEAFFLHIDLSPHADLYIRYEDIECVRWCAVY